MIEILGHLCHKQGIAEEEEERQSLRTVCGTKYKV